MSMQFRGSSYLLLMFTLLLSLPLFFSSCTTEPAYPTAEEAEKAILEKEHAALKEWSAGNPEGFVLHAANDVTYFDDIGAHNRMDGIEETTAYLASLKGMIPEHDYELKDAKVQVYGDMAILTFHYVGSVGGQAGQPWKASSVFRYVDGDWKSVHEHWSLVKAE